MYKIVSATFISLFLIGMTSHAVADAGEDYSYLTASQSLSANAEVISIDLDSRMVELQSPDGKVLPYKIAESTRNLDQVEVGDVVDYQFESQVTLILLKQAEAVPEAMDKVTRTRAKPGEKPQMTTETRRVQTATVLAIDLETSAFTLEWADGSIEAYTTEETEMLKKASIGDHLVKTQTERLVISVSPPDQE
jgi:hypothetical protein